MLHANSHWADELKHATPTVTENLMYLHQLTNVITLNAMGFISS